MNISRIWEIINVLIVGVGEENYYLLAPNFKFIKKDKIDYDIILDGIYVPDSKETFEQFLFCKIHSIYD